MSDSDESEDELAWLASDERNVQSAKQQQDHATDQYAAAVAAVFLNTTSKVALIPNGTHDSSATKLATDVARKEHGTAYSNLERNVTEIVSDDLNAISSSALLSSEHATWTDVQNGINLDLVGLQPAPSTRVDQQLILSATEAAADEEMKLSDYIVSELSNGLNSTACSELNGYLNSVELLSPDKCGALSDVCDDSFFGDLSFIDECLVEDCGSSQLLGHSSAADDVNDIQKLDVVNQRSQLNECTSEIVSNHDVSTTVDKSAAVSQLAAVAGLGDGVEMQQTDACFQQSVQSYSQTSTANSNPIVSVNCERASKPAGHVASTLHQRTLPVSTSASVTGSQLANHLATDDHQAVTCQSSMPNCEVQSEFISAHLDLLPNELVNLTGTTAIDSDDPLQQLVSSSENKVACESTQDSWDMSSMEIGSADNLPSAAPCKRLLAEEFADASCKRFRAEADCLSAEWLSVIESSIHENVANNSDMSAISAATQSASDVSMAGSSCDEDVQASNADELHNVCCCCCNLPHAVSSLSYCTDGHACCQTCLQHQVKRLLSSLCKA